MTMDKPRWLPALIILFVLAKSALLFTHHLVIWDEAVYIGMGKYIYSAGQAGLWEQIRPPGLPLLLGLLWRFGLDPVFFGELLAIAFAALTLWLVARVGRHVLGGRDGLVAALLLAVMPLFFLYSSYILTEIPSTALVLLALDAFLSRKPFLAGLAAGGAFLFRFPHGLALLVFLALFLRERDWKGMGAFLTGWSLPVLPFLAANTIAYRPYTSELWHATFRPMLLAAPHAANPAVPASNALFYARALLAEAPYFALFAIALISLAIHRAWRKPGVQAVLLFAIAYVAYFTFIPNRQDRFLLQFLPFLALLTAPAITGLFDRRERKRILHPHALRVGVALAVTVLVLGVGFSLAKDLSFYPWRSPTPEPLTEFYTYFVDHPVDGPVLTADPVLAAYTDERLIPYYFFLEERPTVLNEWERDVPAAAVAYSPRSFYCAPDDDSCWTIRERLFTHLLANYRLVYQNEFKGSDYYTLQKA